MIRSVVGAGGRFGAIHSQMPVSWFMGVPGLKIVVPVDAGRREGAAEGRDPRRQPGALLRAQAAVRRSRARSTATSGRLGEAMVVREGRDITLVTAMKSVHDSLEAADALEQDRVSVEVIDLRTLRPFDVETVLASVRKTNRLVVVEEGPLTGGWAGEVLASVTERGLGYLDDAWRIATPEHADPVQPAARGRVPARARSGSRPRSDGGCGETAGRRPWVRASKVEGQRLRERARAPRYQPP